jgi:hypothetical protein
VISRREVPIKRDDLDDWLRDWDKNAYSLPAWIQHNLASRGLEDETVDMGELGEMKLLDVIMAEVPSYGRDS